MKSLINSATFFLFTFLVLSSCEPGVQQNDNDFYTSELFKQVQLVGVFEDSKTFVDCVPKRPLKDINAKYWSLNITENFDLRTFVMDNFDMPEATGSDFESDTSKSMVTHIEDLWPVLTRQPDQSVSASSLIPLPFSYIVPGGRFREIYYWDSYFTMEGLMISDQQQIAVNMVNNFQFLIDSLGFIPNGNRAYYSGRSQPPFFSLMVKLVAGEDRTQFLKYHDALIKEYSFWMNGQEKLNETNIQFDRVVSMPDGSVLNRYWDAFDLPRPESYKPDYELVQEHQLDEGTTYRHLRAGAESGWDYSSRWFSDATNLSTIHTTDIIPVDLNALMYHLEIMIAQGYNWNGDLKSAQIYLDLAERRKSAISKYLWDEADQFYIDFDYVNQSPTGVLSLAASFPLYFNLATKNRAKAVAERLENEYLKPGGFVTTLNETGQQWDAPNGWAPLQWITINALYNYGFSELGNEAAGRWLKRNEEVYKSTGKMMEKYNVIDIDLLAGGGEYGLQDGFGWTNGVALALNKILQEKALIEEMRTAN